MNADEFLECFSNAGGKLTSDLEQLLKTPSTRDELYSTFHMSPSSLEPRLLGAMLEIEVAHYKSDDEEVDCDRLYWCAYLLSKCGRVEDVLPIWRAKQTDFDTGCGLDVQSAIGPGLDETIKFLAESGEPDAPAALEYIRDCQEAGDFDDMKAWRASRDHYFMPRNT